MSNINIGSPFGPFKTRVVLVNGEQWGVIQVMRKGQYKVKCDRMIFTCPKSGVKSNVRLCDTLAEAKQIIQVGV